MTSSAIRPPHSPPTRRGFLRALATSAAFGAGALAAARLSKLAPALAAPAAVAPDDFFVFVHAAGGWDVTLLTDPRNEHRGIIDPATTENTDTRELRLWVDAPFDGDVKTFAPVQPKGSSHAFGPGIGGLVDFADRLTVVNGLAMNTVSHPDGSAYAATGRHLVGGRAPASSVDTMLANELGRDQLLPTISLDFPSFYVGEALDRRVVPLRIGQVGAFGRILHRPTQWLSPDDRDAIGKLVALEARDLAALSASADVFEGMALQTEGVRRMLGEKLDEALAPAALKKSYPELDAKAKLHAGRALGLAFAVEAMKRNLVRCTSLAFTGFDTHASNYRQQARLQQEMCDLLAAFLQILDRTPHPTRPGTKLADRTHLLVISDFCRTPQINLGGGRDHYPNNSALIVSPRFKGNAVHGKTDPDQLLSSAARTFAGGPRALTPPDLLATFVSAFGAEPRRYLRDGEIVPEMLKS
jgi:hypothetical protein